MLNLTDIQKAAFNPNGARTILWDCTFEYINEDIIIQSVSGSAGSGSWAPINNINDGNTEILPFATYELNGWPLDGTAIIIPENQFEMTNPSKIPYFGNEISDADGYYSKEQWVRCVFADNQDLPATTIYWGKLPPVEYTIQWYSGNMGTLLNELTVTNNSESFNQIFHGESNVGSVQIKITKGQPFTRYKIVEWQMGATLILNKENSESMSLSFETDFFSERTVAGSIEVVTENFDQAFDVFNPKGLHAYFRENMKLVVRIGAIAKDGSEVWCPMGIFYLRAPSSTANLTSIILRGTGSIDFLKNIQYPISDIDRFPSLEQLAWSMSNKLDSFTYSIEFDPYVAPSDGGIGVIHSKSLDGMPTMSYADLLALGCNGSYYTGNSQFRSHYCLTEQRSGGISLRYVNPSKPKNIVFTKADYDENSGLSVEIGEYYNAVRGSFEGNATETVSEALLEIISRKSASEILENSKYYTDHTIIVDGEKVFTIKHLTRRFDSSWIVIASDISNPTPDGIIHKIRIDYYPSQTREIEKIQENVNPAQLQYYQVPDHPGVRFGGNGTMTNIDPALYLDFYYRYKTEKRLIAKMNFRGYPYLDIGDVATFDVGNGETQKFFITKLTYRCSGGMTGTLEAHEI